MQNLVAATSLPKYSQFLAQFYKMLQFSRFEPQWRQDLKDQPTRSLFLSLAKFHNRLEVSDSENTELGCQIFPRKSASDMAKRHQVTDWEFVLILIEKL